MFNSFILGSSSNHLSHTARPRDTARMAKIIDAECETDDAPKVARKRKRKPNKMKMAAESDNEDNNFVESSSDSDSTAQSEDSDSVEITNEEVRSFY